MRTLLMAVVLWMAATASAETELYKWTDKDGLVHFSDQPGPGAEKIKLRDLSVNSAPAPQPGTGNQPAAAAFEYEKITVTSPPNNGTVRDNNGAVSVAVEVTPALRVDLGHTMRVSLDGQSQGGTATAFAFTGVERGTHNVSATVLDRDGKPLKSASSTFTLQRVSKLLKKNQ